MIYIETRVINGVVLTIRQPLQPWSMRKSCLNGPGRGSLRYAFSHIFSIESEPKKMMHTLALVAELCTARYLYSLGVIHVWSYACVQSVFYGIVELERDSHSYHR